jgi:DNA-binding transcriptional regulator GbsR (MarR family)
MEKPGSAEDRRAQARLREMHELIELLTRWSDDVQKLENEDIVQVLKLGGRVVKLLELKNRLPFLGRGGTRDDAEDPAFDEEQKS